jgi:hypothetical protein
MSVILLVALIILAEKITGKSAIELVTWLLKEVWTAIEWVILFLTGMNEPRGGRS